MLTKYGNTVSDLAILDAFKKLNIKYKKYSFLKRGSDERQYNSPGIDLPIASIFKMKYKEYKEYHTSLDDFKLVTIKGITQGFKVSKTAIEILLKKIIPINNFLCEPHMSKRDLYPTLSSKDEHTYSSSNNLMNFLQYADGKNDLLSISKFIKLKYNETVKIYNLLVKRKLIN